MFPSSVLFISYLLDSEEKTAIIAIEILDESNRGITIVDTRYKACVTEWVRGVLNNLSVMGLEVKYDND